MVIGKDLGFLRKEQRISVALARECDDLIIIVDSVAMNRGYKDGKGRKTLTLVTDGFQEMRQAFFIGEDMKHRWASNQFVGNRDDERHGGEDV